MAGRPRPIATYNLAGVQCAVDDVPISNYGEDGAIDIEYPSMILESKVSADGFVVYEVTNDDRVTVKITVSAMSRTAKLLMDAKQQQDLALASFKQIPPLPFGLNDPATGDELFSSYCIFMQTPSISKGKAAGTREFQFELPYAKGNVKIGKLNVQ